MFMVTRQVDIGMRPSTFLPINMLDKKFPTQNYPKMLLLGVCMEKLSKTCCCLYSHQNYHFYPYSVIPPHPHTSITQQPHPNMPPHPICLCPYCTSSTIYAPYGVEHHLHIPYFVYLYHLPYIFIPSSISLNLLPPDLRPNS